MKHLDLFSGYGGFKLACEKYGIETIGFSEVDKYACAVLKYRFPSIKNYGDVTRVSAKELPDVDLITGGSPCQDLSTAGKRAGLDGARSGLFFHFVRLIRELGPRYFIWENVKGALSSNQGWDFARVQIEMVEAGYDLQWIVLNSKDYGVPQNRERIFVVGARKGCGQEILRLQEGTEATLGELTAGQSQGYRVYGPELAISLASQAGGVGAKTGLYMVNDLSRKHPMRYADHVGTLRTQNRGNGPGLACHKGVRKLTPLECERVMGIPDNWTQYGMFDGETKEISDTQRYKMCGNGVVPQCVYPLVEAIEEEIS